MTECVLGLSVPIAVSMQPDDIGWKVPRPMGSPTYFAVPARADFEAFSALCDPAFHKRTYAAFCAWVDEQIALLQRSGRRAIEVPLDLGDFLSSIRASAYQ
jgi:hypothetical protein